MVLDEDGEEVYLNEVIENTPYRIKVENELVHDCIFFVIDFA